MIHEPPMVMGLINLSALFKDMRVIARNVH